MHPGQRGDIEFPCKALDNMSAPGLLSVQISKMIPRSRDRPLPLPSSSLVGCQPLLRETPWQVRMLRVAQL